MKKMLHNFLACLLVAGLVPAAFAGTMGTERLISTDPSLGSQFPNVAYSGSAIHIVWVGYATGQQGHIFYSQSTNNGSTFSAPVNLSAGASTNNDRPQVTAKGSTIVVAWNSDNNTGALYLRVSTNAGTSFGNAVAAAGAEGDGFYARLTDLMMDSNNNIHVAYYENKDTNGSAGMVHHRMSCNNGAAFGTDVAVTSNAVDGVFDNEEPRLAELGGKIFVVYKSSAKGNPQGGWPPYTILMKTGIVADCTLTEISFPARRVAGGLPLSLNTTYRPDVFSDGSLLHFVWWDNTNGANVAYRNGNPATSTLGAPSTISAFGVDHLEPGALSSTAAAAAGGFQAPPAIVSNGTQALMAYQRNAAKTAQNFEYGPIYLRESTDNGTTWGLEQPVAGTSQATTPRIAVSGQNTAIVWSDIRTDPTPSIRFRLYSGGPATGPQFSISPNPQDFGSVVMGASASKTFQVVNSGLSGSIIGVSVSGDFTIATNGCGSTLGAGGSCNLTVNFSPSTLGARSGTITLSTNAADSPTTATITGTGLQAPQGDPLNRLAVIRGFYETILGRTPDTAGVNFWNSEATRVTGLGADVREVFFALSVQFFNTPEYLNKGTSDTQFLTDLYNTFFLRTPDAAGLAYWQSQLTGGLDRGALLTNFLFSTEFSNKMNLLFGTASVRPEINMAIDLYRGILGVLPDSAGFNFWMGQIRIAQCAGAGAATAVGAAVSTIAEGFITSAEYSQRESARPASERQKRHIGDLYNAFLRRGADLAGYQFWAGQLESGALTRAQVRAEYIKSPEFQGRVTQVIAAGCKT